MTKILSYSIVGLLAVALVAGTGYILLNPTDVQGQSALGNQGQGRGGAGQSGDEAFANGQGQSQGRGNRDGEGGSAYGNGRNEELSAQEITGVLYMREEEKLARDVYLTLYEQWELPIFQNIADSEQAHMDAIETLIDRYGLQDPTAGNDVGEFTDPTLQSLYADLVATGSQSLADALRVGAAIEEIDILDLEEYVAQASARDILRVYESLTRGSRNHLRSFVATLEQQAGETYEPQYLGQEAYDSIVNAPMESGGYGPNEATQGRGAFGSGAFGAGASDGRGQDQGQGRNETVRTPFEWETLTGKVTAIDGDVTIQTAEGEVLVGMGQSAYREGFELAVGDEITVIGFHEDGEFKAGSVENLTSGETILLRDETGRPAWSGQGRLQNQGLPGDLE